MEKKESIATQLKALEVGGETIKFPIIQVPSVRTSTNCYGKMWKRRFTTWTDEDYIYVKRLV